MGMEVEKFVLCYSVPQDFTKLGFKYICIVYHWYLSNIAL